MTQLAIEPLKGEAFRSIKPDEWYTVAEVAELCRVCRLTVTRWIARGTLKAEKQAGARWRVLGASIIATAPGIYSATPPTRTETATQRDRRAEAAMKRIGQTTKGKR